jgi:hypothetical protein
MPVKRQPKRRERMRSFRIPVALDRQLAAAARERGFSRSMLLREIVTGWLVFDGMTAPSNTMVEGPGDDEG